MRPFHLAFPVDNLTAAKAFYGDLLGCGVGRECEDWVDFNFFGHQITAHLAQPEAAPQTNPVDGQIIPVRHFGLILEMQEWQDLQQRLTNLGVKFKVLPQIRFRGKRGEQATFFIVDPSGNHLEFKAFQSDSAIFES